MKKDKEIVIEYFKSKGFKALHFPRIENQKSPDFKIYLNNTLWAYCELKSIVKDEWVKTSIEKDEMEGERNDPTFNRIQSKIHNANKQFKSVNPQHEKPNILVFVNHERHCGRIDLKLVVSGKGTSTEGEFDFDHRYRNRLLEKGDLLNIDLIIWFDDNRKKPGYHILAESKFNSELRRYLQE